MQYLPKRGSFLWSIVDVQIDKIYNEIRDLLGENSLYRSLCSEDESDLTSLICDIEEFQDMKRKCGMGCNPEIESYILEIRILFQI
jgi:hypothetical protein